MEYQAPILLVEFVSIDSKLQPRDVELLRKQFTKIPDHSHAYELPETVCLFPENTPLTVWASFHTDTQEIILRVSSGGKLLLGLMAIAHGLFEASTSVKADTDLRITLIKEIHDA